MFLDKRLAPSAFINNVEISAGFHDDISQWLGEKGVLYTNAFQDIIDSNNLNHSACLCCYEQKNLKEVKHVEKQLKILLKYYDDESYKKSISFKRNIENLKNDVPILSQEMIKHFLKTSDDTSNKIRNYNMKTNFCIAEPKCGNKMKIWVYSTNLGRIFLKKLEKKCKRDNIKIEIYPIIRKNCDFPRFNYKMYVAEIKNKENIQAFWQNIHQSYKLLF